MRILAFDVAVTGCATAYYDLKSGEKLLLSEETDRGQAERLIPMIEDLMNKACVSLAEIDRIAVTRGPGSFTGVRIGLSTARTLGMALSIPVLGFSTLELVLEGHKEEKDVLAVIDTKRGDFYGQTKGTPPRIYEDAEIKRWKGILMRDERPDLLLMAELAGKVAEEKFALYPPTPLYLRDAEVTFPS